MEGGEHRLQLLLRNSKQWPELEDVQLALGKHKERVK